MDLKAAREALRRGDKKTARHIAQQIVAHDSTNEDAWLILAAVSSPESAVHYLQKVLELNPQNQAAKKGLEWYAAQTNQTKAAASKPTPPVDLKPKLIQANVNLPFRTKRSQLLFPWLFIFLCGALILIIQSPVFPSIAFSPNLQEATLILGDNPTIEKATLTPTFTQTPTSTPLPTNTPEPTLTPTNTLSPTVQPTATLENKTNEKASTKKKNQPNKPIKTKPANNLPLISPPKGISESEHWVEVDLSSQRSSAYIGSTRVKTFLVSTGTWLHPTVTGVFKIYVKYRYANMSGPGYFLPDVPYVMYFYQDYGLHGTYWHHNFGVPMSHGCVNYSIPDAAWLYDFVKVGTIVYIHQ